jgi:hypothetical protein
VQLCSGGALDLLKRHSGIVWGRASRVTGNRRVVQTKKHQQRMKKKIGTGVAVTDSSHRNECQPHGVPDKEIVGLLEFVVVDNPHLCLRPQAVGVLVSWALLSVPSPEMPITRNRNAHHNKIGIHHVQISKNLPAYKN